MTGFLNIILLSLLVSGVATLAGGFLGSLAGLALGLWDFPGRPSLLRLIRTLMGMPPVVAGLLVYLALSRRGPLGVLGLLFTPTAMIVAQTLLVFPIVTGMVAAIVALTDARARQTALAAGATRTQAALSVAWEAWPGMVAAVVAGFGRAIGEVGAVMLVGGNIGGRTRVMTGAIFLETRQGNFSTAILLGLILLAVAFLVNLALERLERLVPR
ncbi:MAG: ABC transporter permease [Bacillota bacterium]